MTELGFWEQFTIAISSVVVGGIITHFLTHGWQNYHFKIQLKKEVFELFQKSGKRSFVIQDSLTRKLAQHYAPAELPINKATEVVQHQLDHFSTIPDDLPENVFREEYQKFNEELKEIRLIGDELISKLKMYFNEYSCLDEEYTKIRVQSGVCSQHIRKAILATTKDDFVNNINKFHDESLQLKNMISVFENKLIREKIRKVIV